MRQPHLAQQQTVMFGCFSQVAEDMLNFHENFNYYPIGQIKYAHTNNMRSNNKTFSYGKNKNR